MRYFDKKPGAKALYLDNSILKMLTFVIGPMSQEQSSIKEKRILSGNIPMPPSKPVQSVIFILRPEPEAVSQVLYQWNQMNGPTTDREFYVLFVPRRTIECDEMLIESGMFSEVNKSNIAEINMDLVPLDEDLLSLEEPNNFKHHLLEDDDTYKVYAQYSIHRLESIYGKIPHKFGIGPSASKLIKMVDENRLNVDQTSNNSTYGSESEIDALIMFDRKVDLVTPFCMMQTFEGFMDEHIGIHMTKVKISNSVIYPDAKVREELKINEKDDTDLDLTSETPLYADIRDKHFDLAGRYLGTKL